MKGDHVPKQKCKCVVYCKKEEIWTGGNTYVVDIKMKMINGCINISDEFLQNICRSIIKGALLCIRFQEKYFKNAVLIAVWICFDLKLLLSLYINFDCEMVYLNAFALSLS